MKKIKFDITLMLSENFGNKIPLTKRKTEKILRDALLTDCIKTEIINIECEVSSYEGIEFTKEDDADEFGYAFDMDTKPLN